MPLFKIKARNEKSGVFEAPDERTARERAMYHLWGPAKSWTSAYQGLGLSCEQVAASDVNKNDIIRSKR